MDANEFFVLTSEPECDGDRAFPFCEGTFRSLPDACQYAQDIGGWVEGDNGMTYADAFGLYKHPFKALYPYFVRKE